MAIGRFGTSRVGGAIVQDFSSAARVRTLRSLFATLIVLASSLSLVAPAGAAIRDVCPSGCTYSTIKAAVTAAVANDTITVGAGTYNETNILINKPLVIQGAGRDQVIVTGASAGTSVPMFDIRPPASGTSGPIELSGMTITDPPVYTASGFSYTIRLRATGATTAVPQVVLRDLDVYGAADPMINSYGVYGGGSVGRTPSGLVVDNSQFLRHRRNGILLEDWNAAVTVTNSTFDRALLSPGSNSGFLEHTSAVTTSRITAPRVITGNTFEGSGLWWALCSNTGTQRFGYDNILVDSNVFKNVVQGDSAINVGGNDCGVTPAMDTELAKMANVVITNNVITADGNQPNINAVRIAGPTTSVTITDNSITGTPRAVHLRPETVIGSPSGVVINDNRLIANDIGLLNESPNAVDARENWWGCQKGPESGSSYCSPIDNPGGGLIDASTWFVTTPTLDLVATTRAGSGTATLRTLNTGVQLSIPVLDGLPASWDNTPGTVTPTSGILDFGLAENTSVTVPGPEACGGYWTTFDAVVLANKTVTGEPVPIYWCVIEDPGFIDTVTPLEGTPVSFAVTNGALPLGLTLDPATGVISGDPGQHGRFDFQVTVTFESGPPEVLKFVYLVVAPPVITNEPPAKGSVGSAYSHNMTATGATPMTWSIPAGMLPPGLSLDPDTGVISGTPTTAGTYTFSVQVENEYGTDVEEYTVIVGNPPIITSGLPPDGEVGVAYTHPVTASGDPTITYSIVAGSLPAGLSLDAATGVISGTPTEHGTFNFSVEASNEWGTDTESYTITVGDPPVIGPALPPNGELGDAYSHLLVAEGATPMTWSIVGGALPPGVTLNPATGLISGTPTADGSFTFTVQATNAYGTDTAQYTVVIGDLPIITSGDPADGEVGSGYVHALTADGATPMTWSIVGGSLPPGLTLDPVTGVISGTPTQEGAFTFTVEAKNQYGTDSAEYSIVIGKDPVITSDDPPDGTQGSAYNFTVVAGGPGPITFSVVSGALPPGLTLDPVTGVISGTPTATGSFTFTVRASNAYGVDDVVYTMDIAAPVTTTTVLAGTTSTTIKSTSTTARPNTGATTTTTTTLATTTSAVPGGATSSTTAGPASSRVGVRATQGAGGSSANRGLTSGGSENGGPSAASGRAASDVTAPASRASVSGAPLDRSTSPSAAVAGATLTRSSPVARTGFDPARLLLLAGAMLVFGAFSIAAASRRRQHN